MYEKISGVIGGIAAFITFFASWFSFCGSYGLLGVALGWFPAAILALFAAVIAGLLWPLAAIGLLVTANAWMPR